MSCYIGAGKLSSVSLEEQLAFLTDELFLQSLQFAFSKHFRTTSLGNGAPKMVWELLHLPGNSQDNLLQTCI